MRPNVLVIVTDALRADRVGALGGGELTPNIDKLASESAVFTNAFTTSNTTDSAITSLHTGRYPLSHGVVNLGPRVTDQEKSAVATVTQLPEILSEAGYRTAAFGRYLGRWHRRGFDRYPTIGSRKREVEIALSEISPFVRNVGEAFYRKVMAPIEEAVNVLSGQRYFSDGSTDEVLERFESYMDGSTPQYAFVHLMNTHIPYTVDGGLVKRYLQEYDYDVSPFYSKFGSDGVIPKNISEGVSKSEDAQILEKYYYSENEPSTAVINAHYDAAVREADERVGRITGHLRNNDLYEDTIIFLISDHGESLTEHGIFYDHHGLYDVSVHIPLLIRTPNRDMKRVDDLVSITDIAPTIESYLGVDELDSDGRSLRPLIEKNESINREFVMAEEAHTQRRRMIRSKRDKLIYLVSGNTICRYCNVEHAPEVELYDLREDPKEQRNIVSLRRKDGMELLERARSMAKTYRAKCPDSGAREIQTYEDEEEVYERLEALGYR